MGDAATAEVDMSRREQVDGGLVAVAHVAALPMVAQTVLAPEVVGKVISILGLATLASAVQA